MIITCSSCDNAFPCDPDAGVNVKEFPTEVGERLNILSGAHIMLGGLGAWCPHCDARNVIPITYKEFNPDGGAQWQNPETGEWSPVEITTRMVAMKLDFSGDDITYTAEFIGVDPAVPGSDETVIEIRPTDPEYGPEIKIAKRPLRRHEIVTEKDIIRISNPRRQAADLMNLEPDAISRQGIEASIRERAEAMVRRQMLEAIFNPQRKLED